VSPASPSINTSQQPAAATVGGSSRIRRPCRRRQSDGTVTFNLYNNATGRAHRVHRQGELSSGTATSQLHHDGDGDRLLVVTYNGDAYNSSVSSSTARSR